MSYHKRGSSGYLVVRRKGNGLVHVVAGTHFPTKKRAQKEANKLNRAYDGSEVKFDIRPENWRKPHWYS